MYDHVGGLPGRSETFDQRKYEEELLKHQKQKNFIVGPTRMGHDLEAQQDDDDDDDDEKRRGFLARKWRHFWEHVVKPAFPEAIQDIKIILGMAAIRTRVKMEMGDASLYPEIQKTAEVRRGLDLCPEEKAFLLRRREVTRRSFAKFMGVPLHEVHPDDVPVISFGGSGGGFRALIGYLGYAEAMKERGLWDCLTYVAGVSGTCWAIGAYYTIGECNLDKLLDHCKTRFSPYHPLSSDAVRAILSVPGGAKLTLGPIIQKHSSGLSTYAMDLYSVLTCGWILFQGEAKLQIGHIKERDAATQRQTWLQYSKARAYTDDGKEPLPIMTAIRHERLTDYPPGEEANINGAPGNGEPPNTWYQWFEMTPYEVGCDEVEGWCPTWGFGRPFKQGKSTMQLPEQSLSLLMGLATSAPAAPLTSYLSTISRNLSYGLFGTSIRTIAGSFTKCWGERGTEEFGNHHPLHACDEHNFLYQYTPLEPGQKPVGIENSKTLELIDSGMDNNCPTYVLLHPKRDMDVIINLDASSDVQNDAFQERVDQIGSRRGVRFTKREDPKPPVEQEENEKDEDEDEDEKSNEASGQVDANGTGAISKAAPNGQEAIQEVAKEEQDNTKEKAKDGPKSETVDSSKMTKAERKKLKKAEKEKEKANKEKQEAKIKDFTGMYAQIYDGVTSERPSTVVDSYGRVVTNPPAPTSTKDCSMIYMPILPNEAAVAGFDPSTAKFSGSYNLIWSPEQIDMLVKLSKANFEAGEEAIRTVMREAWQRRKERREAGKTP